jgi:hypothetical protein
VRVDDFHEADAADLGEPMTDVPGAESAESQARRSSRGRRGGRGRGKQTRKDQQELDTAQEPHRELTFEEFDPNAGRSKPVPEPKRVPAVDPVRAPEEKKAAAAEKAETPASKTAPAESAAKKEEKPKAPAKRAPRRRGGTRPKGTSSADEGKDA